MEMQKGDVVSSVMNESWGQITKGGNHFRILNVKYNVAMGQGIDRKTLWFESMFYN